MHRSRSGRCRELNPAVLSGVVHVRERLSVGGPRRFESLVTFFQLVSQLDDLLFQGHNLSLEPVDICGCPQPGFVPCLLAEQLGQLLLRLLVVAGQSPDAGLGLGRIGPQRCHRHQRRVPFGRQQVGLGGVDLGEQIGMPIEKCAVDACSSGDYPQVRRHRLSIVTNHYRFVVGVDIHTTTPWSNARPVGSSMPPRSPRLPRGRPALDHPLPQALCHLADLPHPETDPGTA